MERFDKVQREREAAASPIGTGEPGPTTNGVAHDGEIAKAVEGEAHLPSHKRKSSDNDVDADDLIDVKDTPSTKKVKKTPKKEMEESDEQMAKRLQAAYAAGARSTRRGGGGGSSSSSISNKKKPAVKEKKVKKKSAAKIKSDDDSELDTSASPKPPKEKKTGGFNKPLNLSMPLQNLLGESQLSRPETVKRIWMHIKANGLQDPKDKRQIVCDDAMKAVFKSDKVHMFTMNKILAGQLYPIDE